MKKALHTGGAAGVNVGSLVMTESHALLPQSPQKGNLLQQQQKQPQTQTEPQTPPPAKRKTILPPQLSITYVDDGYSTSDTTIKTTATTTTTSTEKPQLILNQNQLEKPSNYMHINLSKRVGILNDQIEQFALQSPHYSKFVNPAFPTPLNGDLVWICGRILRREFGDNNVVDKNSNSNKDSKNNTQKITHKFEIETSRSLGSGSRTPLDLELMNASSPEAMISLFPGQLVVLEGRNLTGNTFQVVNCSTDPLSFVDNTINSNDEKENISKINTTVPTKIVSAAGPYHMIVPNTTNTNNNKSWRPFERLLNMVFEMDPQPHVLLLQGPFGVDWVCLKKEIVGRLKLLLGRKKELIVYLQPSSKDHLFPTISSVVPQIIPSNITENYFDSDGRIKIISNPSTLTIPGTGDCQFFSEDILLHISEEEFSNDILGNGDPSTRLISYLNTSSSLYPLLPAPIPLDLESLSSLEILPSTKIVICPSILVPPFCKKLSGRIFLNNGPLKEGDGGHVGIVAINSSGRSKIEIMRFD